MQDCYSPPRVSRERSLHPVVVSEMCLAIQVNINIPSGSCKCPFVRGREPDHLPMHQVVHRGAVGLT